MTNPDLAAILAQALKLPASERPAFLDQTCGGDATLRARVNRMLKAYEESGVFPAEDEESREAQTAGHSPASLEGPGSKIGPYKLLQQIGEGGFGFVYMAEQHEPLRRKVALKIVKPGMDTREVIARFEAERQALALMDHPNIARVLDAGATESGRPYFVMELVRGVSLTEYCDKNQLSTRERLELFSTICQAVQHAHQKGIIHRDLKPSNILVTLHDGKPVPKVIDFGVAKALNQQLTEKTLFTAYGQMVGTPQYMSPEQAEMSGLDVDTRSDIYSLGVMLYELLTGTTPLDSQRLRSAGFAEMQRIIREEEPPKPSTRISTLGAEATSVAQHRSADPRRLRQELVGELDWIVMKALEKDRSRRYASASSLVDDVQRFLEDEPVLACPPRATYRLAKFARRNKAILAMAGAIALALLAGAVLSTVMALRAVHAERLAQEGLASEVAARTDAEQAQAAEVTQRHSAETQRDRAEAARRQATTELEHAQAAERQAQANFDQARATVDQYLTTVSESQLLTTPGMQPLRQTMLDTALTFYERFVAERPQDAQLRAGLAAAYTRLGRVHSDLQQGEKGEEYYGKAQLLYESLLKEGQATPEVERGLAEVYFWQGGSSQTVSLCQRRLRQDAEDREAQLLLANAFNRLALDEEDNKNPEEALRLHCDAFRLRSALVMAEPANAEYLGDLGGTVNNVGVLLAQRGQAREALAEYQRGVEFFERAFTAARYSVLYGRFLAIGRSNEAGFLAQLGLADEAIAAYRRVAEVWQRLARDNPALPGLRTKASQAYINLVSQQRQSGREAEAAQTVFQARQMIDNVLSETADAVYDRAVMYAQLAKDAAPGESIAAAGPAAEDLRTAVRALARAATLGYRNREAIENEPALAVLKERREFQTLLKLMELSERIDATAKDQNKLTEMRTLRDEFKPLAQEPLAALLVASPLRTLGYYLMRAGDAGVAQADCQRALEDAKAFYSDLLQRNPRDASLYRERSQVYQWLRDFDKARDDYEMAIELAPDSAESHRLLAWLCIERPDRSKRDLRCALEHIETAVQMEPLNHVYHHDLACVCWNSGDTLRARDEYLRTAQLWAGPVGVGDAFRARASMAAGDYRGAVEWSKSPEPEYYFGCGEHEQVIALVTKAIDVQNARGSDWHLGISTELVGSYTLRAAALTQVKRYQEALADYCKVVELDPSNSGAHVARGLVEFRLKNYDRALADLGKAQELEPESCDLRGVPLRLAAQCPEQRFREGLLALADKSIELTKGAAATYVTRGRLYGAFGQPEQSLADFNKALELEPTSCDAWTSRAEFHADQGQWEQAAADFGKAVEVQSEKARDCGHLARCLVTHPDHRLWKPDQAVEFAKQAISLACKDSWDGIGTYWNTLGVAQYRAGQWQEAVEALRKALEYRGGGEASDWFFLAMAHWQLGNKAEAATWHHKAVQRMSTNEPAEEEADELRRFAEEAAALLGTPQNTTNKPPS